MPLPPQDRKPLFRAADARHKTDFTTAWLPLPEELFGALIEEVRFALDSPLEGRWIRTIGTAWRESRFSEGLIPSLLESPPSEKLARTRTDTKTTPSAFRGTDGRILFPPPASLVRT